MNRLRVREHVLCVIEALPVIWPLLVFCAMPTCLVAAQETFDPEQLVDKWDRTLRSLERVEFVVFDKCEEIQHGVWVEVPEYARETFVRRDEDNWKLLETARTARSPHGTLAEAEQIVETILLGDRRISVQKNFFERIPLVISEKLPPTEKTRFCAGISGGFILGYIPALYDTQYGPDVMRKSRATAVRTTLDSREVYLLESKTPFVKLRVWLDPAEGYLPRRLQLTKGMAELLLDAQRRGKDLQDLINEEIVYVYQVNRFDHVSGTPVVAQYVEESRIAFRNVPSLPPNYRGKVRHLRVHVTLKNIELNPRFTYPDSFSPSTPIPDGTPVQVNEALHLEFVWKNGKIVPKVDEQLLKRLSGHRFLPGPSSMWFWLGLSGLLTVAAVALAVLQRHWYATGRR